MYREDFAIYARPVGASALLTEAAQILERDGWCKFYLKAPDGSHCAVGAIHQAIIEHPELRPFKWSAKWRLRFLVGHFFIFNWNDKSSREIVLAAFRVAANEGVPA